jgi:hypothetical protein
MALCQEDRYKLAAGGHEPQTDRACLVSFQTSERLFSDDPVGFAWLG